MELADINFLAVLAAAVLVFLIGFLWYGPMFGKAWQREVGLTRDDLKDKNMALVFGPALVLMILMAIVIAAFLPEEPIWQDGLLLGGVLGVGVVAASIGINYLFAGRSVALYAIDAGYLIIGLALLGTVIAWWPY